MAQPTKKASWGGALGGVILLGAIAWAINSCSSSSETSVRSDRLSNSKEFVWIRANQRLIAAKLKDPESAQFGNDYVSYKVGGPIVCGTVNARNSFGGYAGPMRYIGGGETIGVFLASEVSDFDSLWRKLC